MATALAAKLVLKLDSVGELSGIRDLLAIMAEHFGACGVILWEVAPGIKPAEGRRLFVQGQYFDGDSAPPFFELPMDSISAGAIRDGKIENHSRQNGAWQVRVNFREALDRLKIAAFVTIPMQLHGATRGQYDSALTFYRRSGPFAETDATAAEEAGRLFPAIYHAVLKTVSLRLLTEVQNILSRAHYPQEPHIGSGNATETLRHVVGIIKKCFRTKEISVFLGDPSTDPNSYDVIASEWPWPVPEIKQYTAGQGGTGWVLKTGKPLQLLDLSHYAGDKEFYGQRYPGMEWSDRAGVVKELRKQREKGPPLSFVCVPVRHRNCVYGAIRCFVQESGPYYFDDDLTETLCSVGDLVADWWVHWLDEGKEVTERKRLLDLLSALGKTNREALVHLARPQKSSGEIAALVLQACRDLAPEVDVFQVWMKHGERNELYLAEELDASDPARAGPARHAFVSLAQDRSDGKINALGEVWDKKEARQVPHVQFETGLLVLPDSPDCRAFTLAPIMVEDAPIGVLAALSHNLVYQQPIMTIVKFIARQLALYEALRQQLRLLQESQKDLQESLKTQGDLLLDFQHQIRSPINMVYTHAEMLAAKSSGESEEILLTIMEASRRASSVASNLRLFIDLARQQPPRANTVAVQPLEVMSKLKRAASNLYAHKALGKELRFEFGEEWRTAMRPFDADLERLELVFDNLLDNSVKYSYAGTTVRISGGLSQDGREVYISFRNQGLRIERGDLWWLTERGQRGSQARLTHPEGTGIGLWMVEQVVKSMAGRIEIIPTDAEGWNEFRVWLRRV